MCVCECRDRNKMWCILGHWWSSEILLCVCVCLCVLASACGFLCTSAHSVNKFVSNLLPTSKN